MNYNAIPLSKRLANMGSTINRTQNMQNKEEELPVSEVANQTIDWSGNLNITDPETGYTPMMGSAMNNNSYTIRVLVERGADLHFKDPFRGRTALHIASKFGQNEAVEQLLHFGALINCVDNAGMTPLMHAAKCGHFHTVTLLMDMGSNPNMQDNAGWGAMHHAAKYGHKNILNLLAERGAILRLEDHVEKKTPLIIAAQYGRKESCKILIDKGSDVNFSTVTEGVTALMMAAKEGHKGTVLTLLDCGAQVNQHDIFGWTATHFAASWGRKETVGLLATYGKADLNFQVRSKQSQLAFMNLKNTNTKDGKPNKSKGGKSGGFDLNADEFGVAGVGAGGETPLVVATKGSQIDVINVLIDCGARLDRKSIIDGKTAVAIAAMLGMTASLECLLFRGANVNIPDSQGRTPLMLAAIAGQTGTTSQLLNCFADINCLDNEGETAMDLARKAGTKDAFLEGILASGPLAKANIVPWLEIELPRMKRGSKSGGPSVFMNSLLYDKHGLYQGLLQRSPDCDVYLVHCLVMVAVACKKAADQSPLDRDDLLRKVEVIDKMLNACMSAQALFIDENLGNTLLINKAALTADGAGQNFRTELLAPAFASGPLALCIENQLTNMLNVPQLRYHLGRIFLCCLRDPGPKFYGVGGRKITSYFLRPRYCPAFRFLGEGLSKLALLVFVALVTMDRDGDLTQFHSLVDQNLLKLEAAIMALIISVIIYEVGQIEEKRWAVSASIAFDFKELERTRFRSIFSHFFQDVWRTCDLVSYVLILLWALNKVIISGYSALIISKTTIVPAMPTHTNEDGRIALALAALPLSVGLMRYPCTFFESFGQLLWTIFLHTQDLFKLLVVFAVTCLAFGIAFCGIFANINYGDGPSGTGIEQFSSITSTFRTLFELIFRNFDLTMFDNLEKPQLGILGISMVVMFMLWTVCILFNMIIARIMATHEDYCNRALRMWMLVKARQVQQYLLVFESSPMCMLPPPFNLIPSALYIPHVLYTWRARLYSHRTHCISLAGTVCDKLLFIVFLVPAALVDYLSLLSKSISTGAYITFTFSLLACPIMIVFNIFCLLLKFLNDPVTTLIVKSRLSDGRLRITYGGSRDTTECIGLREKKVVKKARTMPEPSRGSFGQLWGGGGGGGDKQKKGATNSKTKANNKIKPTRKGAKDVTNANNNRDSSSSSSSVDGSISQPRLPASIGGKGTRVLPILRYNEGIYAPVSVAEGKDGGVNTLQGEDVKDGGDSLIIGGDGGGSLPGARLDEESVGDMDDGASVATSLEGGGKRKGLNDGAASVTAESIDDGSVISRVTDDEGSLQRGANNGPNNNNNENYVTLENSNLALSFTPGVTSFVRVPKQHLSLDFPPNRFPRLFLSSERTKIFQPSLPEFLVDDYTAALNENSDRLRGLADQLLTRLGQIEKRQEDQMKDVFEMLVVLMNMTRKVDNQSSGQSIVGDNGSVGLGLGLGLADQSMNFGGGDGNSYFSHGRNEQHKYTHAHIFSP